MQLFFRLGNGRGQLAMSVPLRTSVISLIDQLHAHGHCADRETTWLSCQGRKLEPTRTLRTQDVHEGDTLTVRHRGRGGAPTDPQPPRTAEGTEHGQGSQQPALPAPGQPVGRAAVTRFIDHMGPPTATAPDHWPAMAGAIHPPPGWQMPQQVCFLPTHQLQTQGHPQMSAHYGMYPQGQQMIHSQLATSYGHPWGPQQSSIVVHGAPGTFPHRPQDLAITHPMQPQRSPFGYPPTPGRGPTELAGSPGQTRGYGRRGRSQHRRATARRK